jgi:hypothetical protein
MSFDTSSIIVSLIVGAAGFVAFTYGRRQGRVPHVAVGILMMGFPYFVPNALLSAGIGALLLGALWFAVYLGL